MIGLPPSLTGAGAGKHAACRGRGQAVRAGLAPGGQEGGVAAGGPPTEGALITASATKVGAAPERAAKARAADCVYCKGGRKSHSLRQGGRSEAAAS